MSEIIERAAEELYLHDAKASSVRWSGWKFASVKKQQTYRDRVSVVLQSVREPTEAMVDRGDNTPTGHSWGYGGEYAACDPIWKAMIDEALK